MNDINKRRSGAGVRLQSPSTKDLRGHQSVRATFRLSEACINAISILSAQLGIKQKSVFDHLLEDPKVLQDMAGELGSTQLDDQDRIQKTFVMSRRSLRYLEEISSEIDAPRDALMEYAIRRLFPIVTDERTKHKQRKELLAEISAHFAKGEALLSKAGDLVGKNDPIVQKLQAAITAYGNQLDDIANFLEKGKLLESFEPK